MKQICGRVVRGDVRAKFLFQLFHHSHKLCLSMFHLIQDFYWTSKTSAELKKKTLFSDAYGQIEMKIALMAAKDPASVFAWDHQMCRIGCNRI
jgi:hypothetical protein